MYFNLPNEIRKPNAFSQGQRKKTYMTEAKV